MMVVKVVLFDLWMTLVFGLTEDPILTLQRLLSGDPEQPRDDAFSRTCLTTNITSPKRFLQHVAAAHGYQVGAGVEAQFRQLLRAERAKATKYGDTDFVLRTLQERGYRIGLISNLWSFPCNRIFNKLGIGQYLEHRLYSFAVGVRKPDPAIFVKATGLFGVTAGECLMVGDGLVPDVEGSLDAGMQAAFIPRAPVTRQIPAGVHTLQSLSDLLEILPALTAAEELESVA